MDKLPKLGLPIIFLAVVGVILLLKTAVTIDGGEAGVMFKRFSGGIDTEQTYGEGFHIVAPWNDMIIYKVRQQSVADKMSVLSVNGLEVDVDGTVYSADHIIVATGARSRELPNLPQDGKKVIGYREAMTLPTQPKKMIVVGSGAIGVEFAYFYNSMGTEVTIVEYLPNVVPVEDEDVSKQLERSFKKSGIKIMTSSEVTKVTTSL